MNRSVFISRYLEKDSPLRILEEQFRITGKSLIKITPIEFHIPLCDWLFFYSKNGVEIVSDTYSDLSNYQIAAIGHGTAKRLQAYGHEVQFIGEGDHLKIANQFKNQLSPRDRICFIRASQSKNTLFNLLRSNDKIDVPVYKNEKLTDVPKDTFDILIFTSSMNAEAYFDKMPYEGQPCIAIGKPTGQKLKQLNIEKIHISEYPSEHAILDLFRTIVEKYD